MGQMRVYRPARRRGWGCGCLLLLAGVGTVFLIGVILLIPLLPQIALGLAGFEEQGETRDVFVDAVPIPTIALVDPIIPPQITINAGSYGALDLDTAAVDVTVGQDGASQVAIATFDEAELLQLCRERSSICATGNPQIRNATVDLRPGGAVINAEFFIPQFGLWQAAGIVLVLNSQTAQVDVIGVDINGVLFSTPPGTLSDSVTQIEQQGNALLREVVISAGGDTLQLAEIYADEMLLTLVMR